MNSPQIANPAHLAYYWGNLPLNQHHGNVAEMMLQMSRLAAQKGVDL